MATKLMNGNTLYVAAAGSGKTSKILDLAYERVQEIPTNKSLAIVTYTSKNQDIIRQRIIKHYGYVPNKIKVLGWYTFLLNYWIRPFKGSVIERLYNQHVQLLFVEGQSGIEIHNGHVFHSYNKGDLDKKFLNKTKIYSDKISEFAFLCYGKNKTSLTDRLNNIFDTIYFDEAQDFACWDYEIIKVLLRSSSINYFICCDPRQCTYSTSQDTKNKKFRGKIDDFIAKKVNTKTKQYIEIDYTTLNVNHRCVEEICDFANKIFPRFAPTETCSCKTCVDERNNYRRTGMFLVRETDVDSFIITHNPTSLIWSRGSLNKVKTEEYYTYGESKGMQRKAILIYPTEKICKFLKNGKGDFNDEARCKFYVAVTRARFSCAIVVPDNFISDINILPFWTI